MGGLADISQSMDEITNPTNTRRSRFERVFRARYDDVRRHAVRCGSPDPDDVAAEVFTALWRRLDDVHDGHERPWLLAAGRKVVANQRRSAGRRDALVERIVAEPDADVGDAEPDDPRVAAALATLRDRDREVLLLAVWEELSTGEIARVLGISSGSAAVRLHRAKRRFRDAYLAHRPTPTPAVGGSGVH